MLDAAAAEDERRTLGWTSQRNSRVRDGIGRHVDEPNHAVDRQADRRVGQAPRHRPQIGRAFGLSFAAGQQGRGARPWPTRFAMSARTSTTAASCFNLAEGELCPICSDPRRDQTQLCVVEQPRDLMALEQAGVYRGLYHVLLGRIAPLDGIGPDQLTIDRLVERVREGGVREIIMATNPTVEGDGTALVHLELAGRVSGAASRGWPAASPPAASWNTRTKKSWPTPSPAGNDFRSAHDSLDH